MCVYVFGLRGRGSGSGQRSTGAGMCQEGRKEEKECVYLMNEFCSNKNDGF